MSRQFAPDICISQQTPSFLTASHAVNIGAGLSLGVIDFVCGILFTDKVGFSHLR